MEKEPGISPGHTRYIEDTMHRWEKNLNARYLDRKYRDGHWTIKVQFIGLLVKQRVKIALNS
jgi:hypothetical protein